MSNQTYAGLGVHRLSKPLEPPGAPANSWEENKAVAITLAISILGVLMVYAFNKTSLKLSGLTPVGAVLGIVLLIAAARSWRFGVKALLVIVVVEGAIRKWFIPSASELVYFYKDILMVAILISYLVQRGKQPLLIKRNIKILSITLSILAAYAFAVVFNPKAPHILVSLLGVKAYCLYIPLLFIVPRVFPDKEKLIAFLKWYSAIVLPVALIGAMQFMDSDKSSSINRYAWSEAASTRSAEVAGFFDSSGKQYVRVTATFSYVSGLSAYLPIMFALLLGLISIYSKRSMSRSLRWLYYMAMSAIVVTAFMTGSRGAILAIGLVAIFFYCFTSRKDLFRRLQQVAVLGVLIFVATDVFFPQAYDAFYRRALSHDRQVSEGLERISLAFSLPLDEAAVAGPLGYGIGATQNAVPALMRILDLTFEGEKIPIAVEGEPNRVMLELGMVGFLLYMLSRIALLITLCRTCFIIRDRESKALAVAILGVLIYQLISGGAVVSHTQNVYQWFLVGMVLALLNGERWSLRAARPMRAAPPRAVHS